MRISLLANSESYDDIENRRPRLTNTLKKLHSLASDYIEQLLELLAKTSGNNEHFSIEKEEFLFQIKNAVDQEHKEKSLLTSRYKERLEFLVNDLKEQQEGMLTDSPSEAFVSLSKDKLEKTIEILKEELENAPVNYIDLEIVSSGHLQSLKDRIYGLEQISPRNIDELECQLSELKEQNEILFSRTTTLENTENSSVQQLDEILTKELDGIITSLNHYNTENSSPLFPSPQAHSEYSSVENLGRLKMAISTAISLLEEKAKFKGQLFPSHSSTRTTDFYQVETEKLKLQNKVLAEYNSELEKRAETLSKNLETLENELPSLQREHEKKLHILTEQLKQYETHDRESRIKRTQEENLWKLQTEHLKQELEELKGPAIASPRELEHIKQIYNDKYEELFRVTTVQINELEQKLIETSNKKNTETEHEISNVRKQENSLREKEFNRLCSLHSKELAILHSQHEDFTVSVKLEISRLGNIILKAISTQDRTSLNGLLTDLQLLLKRTEHLRARTQEDPTEETRVVSVACRRCNNGSSAMCTFHPFLAKSGIQDYLYSSEWHKCRSEQHCQSSTGCLSLPTHYQHSDSAPTLESFLFSEHKPSATTRLDEYLSKFS